MSCTPHDLIKWFQELQALFEPRRCRPHKRKPCTIQEINQGLLTWMENTKRYGGLL